HFQPIISIKQKSIIGVEALARPRDGETGRTVTPMELFARAARLGRTVDLDRLCRRKALKAYSPMADTPPVAAPLPQFRIFGARPRRARIRAAVKGRPGGRPVAGPNRDRDQRVP